VWAFGDSITYGAFATDEAHTYVGLVAASLAVGAHNLGISGAGITDIVDGEIMTISPPNRYDVAVMLVGYNDMRYYGSNPAQTAFFRSYLEHGLVYLTSATREPYAQTARERLLLRAGKLARVADGTRVMVGNCLKMTTAGYAQHPPYNNGSDAVVAEYNAAIAASVTTLRNQGRNVTLVDVSSVYDPYNAGSPDGEHPGNIGHAVIANAYIAAMRA
jgi:lysophospholipase L1-like esterase